jgi:hypothetical protein
LNFYSSKIVDCEIETRFNEFEVPNNNEIQYEETETPQIENKNDDRLFDPPGK